VPLRVDWGRHGGVESMAISGAAQVDGLWRYSSPTEVSKGVSGGSSSSGPGMVLSVSALSLSLSLSRLGSEAQEPAEEKRLEVEAEGEWKKDVCGGWRSWALAAFDVSREARGLQGACWDKVSLVVMLMLAAVAVVLVLRKKGSSQLR
jgi:hypothetical protein